MAENRQTKYTYEQIIGSLEELRNISSGSFDAVLCHNVLEYTTNPPDIVSEFCRLVKPGGLISIVKHNSLGRIMQKVVFENNVDEAMTLLHGGTTKARHFGRVNYYELSDLRAWMTDVDVQIEQVLGIRTFWGLPQDNEIKKQQSWQDDMFEIEMEVASNESFTNVSFFQHILINRGR